MKNGLDIIDGFFLAVLLLILIHAMNHNNDKVLTELKNIETAISQYHDLELQLDIQLNQEEDLRL